MADGDEDSGAGLESLLARLDVLQLYARHLALGRIEHVADGRIPDELDLLVTQKPVLHDLGGAHLVPAMDDVPRTCVAGQMKGFFGRRVTASYHHQLPAAKEGPVAGGASRNSVAEQLAPPATGPSFAAGS